MKKFIRGIGRFIRNVIGWALMSIVLACAGVILTAILAVVLPIVALYGLIVYGDDIDDTIRDVFDAFKYGFENGVNPKEN